MRRQYTFPGQGKTGRIGDHLFDSFIKNKKIEWDQYRIQVTEYELKRYLPIL